MDATAPRTPRTIPIGTPMTASERAVLAAFRASGLHPEAAVRLLCGLPSIRPSSAPSVVSLPRRR